MLADELHFGRAAEKLHVGTPTLSELIRRLETELGTPLFARTTRRVALTSAGAELLGRSRPILDQVAGASAAVRRIAGGETGTVRLGITPPAAPSLAPHLVERMALEAPQVVVDVRQMWLPALHDALQAGEVDVSLTCGVAAPPAGFNSEVVAAQELLVGLRPADRLAGRPAVALAELAGRVLGVPPSALFPAWADCVTEVLRGAGIAPPAAELMGTELGGDRWTMQPGIDWILLIASLMAGSAGPTGPGGTGPRMVVRKVEPHLLVPFSLQWNPERAGTTAVARFVRVALAAELPPGWFHHVP